MDGPVLITMLVSHVTIGAYEHAERLNGIESNDSRALRREREAGAGDRSARRITRD